MCICIHVYVYEEADSGNQYHVRKCMRMCMCLYAYVPLVRTE